MNTGVYVSRILFNEDTRLDLNSDSIVVVTGPNNCGKSTFLSEIDKHFSGRRRIKPTGGPIIHELDKDTKGTADQLIDLLKIHYKFNEEEKRIEISSNEKYFYKTVRSLFEKKELPEPIERHFITRLTAQERLGLYSYRDRGEIAARELFDDEPKEIEISAIFRRAFGVDLILNRSPERSTFHIGDRKELPPHSERFTRRFRKWINQLPLISQQGDGIQSFTRMLLHILVNPKSIILIDEPEVFLHPPQIRHLARMIAQDTPKDTQLFIATHNDDFVRGLIDMVNDRLVIMRMRREFNKNPISTLNPDNLKVLWKDPLLRTSNALSALFHDVAVICEGDSDVRFFNAMLDAVAGSEHSPDQHFYHCGGKDRMPSILEAIRAVNVPTIAVVDIDILSDEKQFLKLFNTMGGKSDAIRSELKHINRVIQERKNEVTGHYFSSELRRLAGEIGNKTSVPRKTISDLQSLIKVSSPWRRIKEDGFRGFGDAETIRNFHKIVDAAESVGILINTEGELESFGPSIPRTCKADWLANALQRDLKDDPEFEEARKFIERLREAINRAARLNP